MSRPTPFFAYASMSLAFLALGSSACAGSAANLRPAEIPKDQGGLFGRVEVVNAGEDVTPSCYVGFTDDDGARKTYLSLDPTGWIFTATKVGRTYLSTVLCTLGGFIKYNATYVTRDLGFELAGGNKLVYFGRVRVDMRSDGSGVAAATIFGGAIGNAIASAHQGDHAQAEVINEFDDAKREYAQRYGAKGAALVPEVSLAGRR